jgi:hypothetical protein
VPTKPGGLCGHGPGDLARRKCGAWSSLQSTSWPVRSGRRRSPTHAGR